MRRRRFYLVMACVAALVAGTLAAGLTTRAALRWERRHVDSLLDEQLRTTQELAGRLFVSAVKTMDMWGKRWTGVCDDAAIQLLRGAVFHSASVREALFLDHSYTVACSNYGPPPRVFTLQPGEIAALHRGGTIIVWVPRSAIIGAPAVAVNRKTANGAVNALIDPKFVDDLLERDVIQAEMWTGLKLADGTIMAGSDKADQGKQAEQHILSVAQTHAWKQVSAPVEGAPLTAVAAMRKPTLATVRSENLALILGVGALGAGTAFAAGLALMRRRLSLEGELKAAIANGELDLHYQPLIELNSGRCAGAEALMRWCHPERGMMRPDLFIPQAEDSGLIVPMTDWMLRRIVADFADGPQIGDGAGAPASVSGERHFHVSINLTSRHFQMADFAQQLNAVFGPSALEPRHILLEATERQVMDSTADGRGSEVIAAVRRWGAGVALDDFGTGYCGLQYLQRYRVDVLKIDKSFVDSIGTDAVSAHVVDAIIDLAKKLDMKMIAEGVEKQEQADYLAARGVHYAQGYLFARPMPIGDFLAFARNRAAGA